MIDYLLDTNVVSRFLSGDDSVKQFLDREIRGGKNYCINAIVYIELIQGSLKKQHREAVKRFLSDIISFPLTPAVSDTAIELIDKYSASHGLFLADALIAATAVEHDLTLVTFNTKDFTFIEEMTAIEP